MSRFTLLQPIAEAAFGRYATTSFNNLSEVDRMVILVWSLQGEVGNGGFDQFYFNSSGDYAAETVEALKLLGARRTAQMVEEGNRLFPTQLPPKQRELRIAELDRFTSSVTGTLEKLEQEFNDDPDGLNEMLVAYLISHGVLPEGARGG